jgi:hypothetical protein
MSINYDEKLSDSDEQLVKAFLESFHLRANKFDNKKSLIKKPDFEVEAKDGFYFFCEVKSLFADNKEGILHKTFLNKIERKIIQSDDKFEKVNKTHLVPNVICFLSNDFRLNYRSLLSFLSGEIDLVTEKLDTKMFRDGLAYKAVRNIDLYIWLSSGNEAQYFFNKHDERFVQKFIHIFKVEKTHNIKVKSV